MAKNQLKSGVVLSYVNLLIGNIIPFVYTPIMLSILGQAEYGLYGIAQSVMGYISLLNFGIGNAVIRYISKYRSENDKEGENRVIGLFLTVYGIIAALILVVGITLSFNLSFYSRSLNTDELKTLSTLVRLMTVNMAVFLPFSVFSSVSIAHEELIFNKLVAIATTVLTPCLNLAMLYSGYGSVGLVLTTTIVNILSYSAYTVYAVTKLGIRPKFKGKVPGLLQEILTFSGFAFLGSIVDVLYWATDKLIIGWAVGSAAVTIYNIGANFNSYITSLSTAISSVLTPRISTLVTKENGKAELSALFIKTGRLQFIIISFILSAFIAFGRQFITLWVGSDYSEAYYVALFTMIPVAVPLIQNTGINILYVLNKHRFRSIVYLCIAILNVILTFWLVESYGIIGAAAATCIAYVIGNIFIINWYYYKKIGLDIPLFWKNIVKMCPTMFICGVVAWFALDNIEVSNWLVFVALAVIYSVVYFVMAFFIMMNDYERQICTDPIKKIARKLHIIH